MPLYNPNEPAPYRPMMFFIDGENIVCRYQELKKNRPLRPEVKHDQDIYVWAPLYVFPGKRVHEVIRAYYYTSVSGDDVKITSVVESIRNLSVFPDSGTWDPTPTTLYPVVFKKPKKSNKAKSVDIQMTVDILRHVYQDNVDTVCLFSGDGDYISLVKEVIRRGKKVYIAAFSQGFNSELKQLADIVIVLDDFFFL